MPDGKPWCYYTEGMEIPGQNCHTCDCLDRVRCNKYDETSCKSSGCHWCPRDGEHACIYGNFQNMCTSCNCPSELKVDCLTDYSGNDPEQKCVDRGCRWCPNYQGDPPCIRGPKPSEKECVIDNDLKNDCGYYGIKEPECRQSNCCWEKVNEGSNGEHGIPWCFYPSNFDY
ncbi:Oidioi.mRNA.OKI2018_I69.chr2.g5002.t1.cds [Oikopleura dioica]|uniref:Oidioi.mRNA.OKI2018_I69.chr2.g5002.t1.cds n=1 Tax=Oikopleura dioica TaxID=34765 RepID=A0ABN7T2V8_OIKDI|nr:Oidioi.mRNA.OKI2018_I69.chr2.g5002.t1.cds [Oikopleura dioica]